MLANLWLYHESPTGGQKVSTHITALSVPCRIQPSCLAQTKVGGRAVALFIGPTLAPTARVVRGTASAGLFDRIRCAIASKPSRLPVFPRFGVRHSGIRRSGAGVRSGERPGGSQTAAHQALDGHVHLDLAMRAVAVDLEVGEGAGLDRVHLRVDGERGERARRALELHLESVDMVEVNVRIADRVHKAAALEPREVGEDAREQSVRRDVERHAQPEVGRALIHLAGERTVCDIKLGKHMAGRQGHLLQVGRVPSGHDDAPIVRLVLNLVEDLSHLVDALPRVVVVHRTVRRAEVAPLPAVHGAEVALLAFGESNGVEIVARRVAVPDLDAFVLQLLGRRLTVEEPEQLLSDASPEDGLGREEGEARREVEAHLHAKFGEGAHARTILALHAVLDHVTHQVEVLHLLMVLAWRHRRHGGRRGSCHARGRR
mmetsp:Transcript_1744/g.4928  ORF Transcript_1744/g.4928 Transcript_1744/m.4928 type:complete len:430 (+) Transcript_1744:290-1579(+)